MGESFPMNSGDGDYSYTKHSQIQKQGSDSVKGLIQDAIMQKLDAEILLSISSALSIADFGCSIGPNTFSTVQNLIEAAESKCYSQGLDSKDMEFQVFFNDHSANDFNALFASLPPDRQYHAAGVAGSFYGRLFPRASISLAHSSYALHWLSKVPEGVSDSKSPAWNRGRIHYTAGAPSEVANAYLDQFETDIGAFLSARVEEIVRGGLMFLILPGIPDGVSHTQLKASVLYNFLGSSLMDLANEGVINKSEIDMFNLPFYFPTAGEMRKLIEKDGCFSIERMEVTNTSSQENVESIVMHIRAATEGVFIKHFRKSVVEKMFIKTLAKAEEISQLLMKAADPISPHLFVLKRK